MISRSLLVHDIWSKEDMRLLVSKPPITSSDHWLNTINKSVVIHHTATYRVVIQKLQPQERSFNHFSCTCQCLHCGNQRMCTRVQPTLILCVRIKDLWRKPIRPVEISWVRFLMSRYVGAVGMLEVHIAPQWSLLVQAFYRYPSVLFRRKCTHLHF